MTRQQKQRLMQAKVAAALLHETGTVPTRERIDEVTLLVRVLYKAVLGVHFKRREQRATGQLPLF